MRQLRGTLLPAIMLLIGVALIVKTLVNGGGPIALGVILGVLFMAAGAGRLYLERKL
jgi:hypothetical protein